MERFIRLATVLSQISGMAAAGLIVAATLAICHMVVVRYVFHGSTVWQTEFIAYSIVAATLIGSPYVLLHRAHVFVGLIPGYLRGRARWLLALFAGTTTFAFAVVMFAVGAELWYEALAKGWRSESVWAVRLWIPYAAMPLGFGVLTVQAVADLLALASGKDSPFGMGGHS